MNVDWCMVIFQPPRDGLKFALLRPICFKSNNGSN